MKVIRVAASFLGASFDHYPLECFRDVSSPFLDGSRLRLLAVSSTWSHAGGGNHEEWIIDRTRSESKSSRRTTPNSTGPG